MLPPYNPSRSKYAGSSTKKYRTPFSTAPSAIAGNRSRVPPIGMVRLGITTADALVPRYRGNTTATSWPCATSAFGSASTTSARPPVFENGSPSDATNRILIAYSLPARSQLRNHFTLPEGCCIVKKSMRLGQSKPARLQQSEIARLIVTTRVAPVRPRFAGPRVAPLATLFPPWLANASASTSCKTSTGARRSRAPSAFRRIPRRRSRATINTVGSKSAPGTAK